MNQHFIHLQACIRKLEACPASLSLPHPALASAFIGCAPHVSGRRAFPAEVPPPGMRSGPFCPSTTRRRRHFCWAPSSPDGLYSEFCRTLNRRLREAQEALIPMRTQRTAPVLNRISSLLTPDKVMDELETAASQYDSFVLDCASHYLSHTEYATYDASEGEAGITWLLGKLLIRHGYDLSPSISALEEDFDRAVTDCRQAFCVRAEQAIQRHILVPMNPLLPILHQQLEPRNP